MNSITKIILTAAASTTLTFSAHAESTQTMKPMHGATFHAGTKHASVYFLNDNATCKLVVMQADDANYAPTRFEAAIADGASKQYPFADGKLLEFACQDRGQAMTINTLDDVATNR